MNFTAQPANSGNQTLRLHLKPLVEHSPNLRNDARWWKVKKKKMLSNLAALSTEFPHPSYLLATWPNVQLPLGQLMGLSPSVLRPTGCLCSCLRWLSTWFRRWTRCRQGCSPGKPKECRQTYSHHTRKELKHCI